MKCGALLVCLVSLAAMTGCAVRAPLVVRNAVGPQRPHVPRPRTDGDLVVYSATHASTYAQSEYPVHTGYTIATKDGKQLERIANEAGPFNANPATVRLPPGEYRVTALADRGGFVVVPFIVEAGKKTVVDLDGEALPQHTNSAASDPDWVRLPDGHVVGWRAKEN